MAGFNFASLGFRRKTALLSLVKSKVAKLFLYVKTIVMLANVK